MIDDIKPADQEEKREEFNWDELFFYLARKLVVPILGSDLLRVKDPQTGEKVLLYDYMHCYLCENMPGAVHDDDYCEFMEKNKQKITSFITPFLNDVQNQIYKAPLIKLAKITDFQSYICMTYDNFFDPILTEERCQPGEKINKIDFSINNKSILPSSRDQKMIPTIYNLMGNYREINGFAKTDEEVLEHLYSLTKKNRFTDNLKANIQDKHFLFIGCTFPNWLLRFLIRILTPKRLSEAYNTKIIADRTTTNDKKLCLFLNHYNSHIYPVPNSTALEFVDELYDRWNEGREQRIKYSGVVFLSYSRQDRDAFVENLYNNLKLYGVNVFYDKSNLVAGDHYREKINKSIIGSKLFIPLISKNSLDPDGYPIIEWKTAMNREKYEIHEGIKQKDDTSFILPFIIDDTKPNDPRIGEIFQDISMQSVKNIDRIIEMIIAKLDE